MKLVVILHDTPHLTEWLLDDILQCVEENRPTNCIDFMFFENCGIVEFEYDYDISDFAVMLMLSFEDIEVQVI